MIIDKGKVIYKDIPIFYLLYGDILQTFNRVSRKEEEWLIKNLKENTEGKLEFDKALVKRVQLQIERFGINEFLIENSKIIRIGYTDIGEARALMVNINPHIPLHNRMREIWRNIYKED